MIIYSPLLFPSLDDRYIFFSVSENTTNEKLFFEKIKLLENEKKKPNELWSSSIKDGIFKCVITRVKGTISVIINENKYGITTIYELKEKLDKIEGIKCKISVGEKWTNYYNGKELHGLAFYIKEIEVV